jgi:hypothetical protein
MKMNAINLSVAVLALSAMACSRETKREAKRETCVLDTAIATKTGAPSAGTGASTPVPSTTNGNVGLNYKSLPAGFTSVNGAVIQPGYDVAYVTTPKGDRIWLESTAGSSKTVVAEVATAPLAPDERLLIASCDVKGKLDPKVIAIGVGGAEASKFTKIRQAWRVNAAAHQFELIPIAGITCEEPGS